MITDSYERQDEICTCSYPNTSGRDKYKGKKPTNTSVASGITSSSNGDYIMIELKVDMDVNMFCRIESRYGGVRTITESFQEGNCLMDDNACIALECERMTHKIAIPGVSVVFDAESGQILIDVNDDVMSGENSDIDYVLTSVNRCDF